MFLPATKMRFISRYFAVQHSTLHTDHLITVCELSFHPRITKKDNAKTPQIDKTSLKWENTQAIFLAEITNTFEALTPEQFYSEELADKIRTTPVAAAERVLPAKHKDQFPNEFSTNTIDLIHRKRKL